MSATTVVKALTIRLQPDLYNAAVKLATKRSLSLNALIQEALAEAVREEEDRELYEAFERLGEHPEECNVEYAFAAQSEVVLRERP